MSGTFSTGRTAVRPKSAAQRLPALQSTRLLDQVRERIRLLHYSRRTEEAYVHWIRAFVRFHGVRHPAQMGGPEVEGFLGWLASERSVSASTHRQALSALIFLYAKVLQIDLPWLSDVGRPRVQRRLPVVLTKEELARIFDALTGEHLLLAQLLYGTGMRISEGLQLRVKDVDFSHRAVIVRGGKDDVAVPHWPSAHKSQFGPCETASPPLSPSPLPAPACRSSRPRTACPAPRGSSRGPARRPRGSSCGRP